jgi:hypothetical protein
LTETNESQIELAFDVVLDGAVIDGRDLAHALIGEAYRLLLPYAEGCPACTDALFSAVANEAIAAELDAAGGDNGSYYVLGGDDAAKKAAFDAHLVGAKARTVELMESDAPVSKAPHRH